MKLNYTIIYSALNDLSSGSGVPGTRITPLFTPSSPPHSAACTALGSVRESSDCIRRRTSPNRVASMSQSDFFWGGVPIACWALIKVITAWSLLRALISNPNPIWKLQCMGCHQHPAESLVILACQTETGGGGGGVWGLFFFAEREFQCRQFGQFETSCWIISHWLFLHSQTINTFLQPDKCPPMP